jgi:hypothetical protein
MKIFDSRNVYRKADRLLEYHIGLLGVKGRNFEKDGEAYYSYNESGDEYLRAGYTTTKKLLSRTFNFELKQVISNIDFDDDFKLKLRFSGFKEISSAIFMPVKGFKGCEDYFNDPELLTFLAKKAKQVELAYIIIEYRKRPSQIEIRICPYAGAFLWVVVPPVFYDMKLRDNEIKTLMEITELLKSYIEKM